MSEASYSDVVETARAYYNSDDADNFYFHIWGGEDIHIGLYEADDESIAVASRRTVEHLANRLPTLAKNAHILDLGSGYGGAARYLARRFGCHVHALNLSEKENARNREKNEADGLADQINVIDGSFEDIPLEDASVDVVWSQDAILHSGQRARVIAEAARVLKPGGQLIFTDPMESGDCDRAALQPVLSRIHLSSLGSFAFYKDRTEAMGLTAVALDDMTPQLVRHYTRVKEELSSRRFALADKVSQTYIDRMLAGLNNWVKAGEDGCLAWGVLHFKKA